MSPRSGNSGPAATLRAMRMERGLSLRALADLSGLPYSTLSKLENGKMALTYDKMVSLAQGLQIDIGRLIGTPGEEPELPQPNGRRSVWRSNTAVNAAPGRNPSIYLAQDLLGKKMSPILIDVQAKSVRDLGGLIRHGGEEFLYVLSGHMELHSDLYAPLELGPGDSVYFDSGMAHGYIRTGNQPCRVLAVCTGLTVQHLARAAKAVVD